MTFSIRTRAGLGLVVLLAAAGMFPHVKAAPIPKHLMKDEVNPELKALQGPWEMAGRSIQGRPLAMPRGTSYTIEFQGEKAILTTGINGRPAAATVKLDPDAKPKRITLTYEPTVPGAAPRTVTYIYKIEDGQFIMAIATVGVGPNGEAIPADFDNVRSVVTTYKRAEK